MSEENVEIPCAFGPEKSVLSMMLKQEGGRARAERDGLTEGHFHIPAHATLFRAIRDAETLELVGFVEDLRHSGALDMVGGPAGVTDIYTYAPNGQHWDDHVRRLREAKARRLLMTSARSLEANSGHGEIEDLQKQLADASKSAADALRGRSALLTGTEAVRALMRRMSDVREGEPETVGKRTGLDSIDLVTGGARPGQLWVIAGETSGGKSVAMLQAAQQCHADGGRVLIVSLEMEAWECIARMAACRGGFSLGVLMEPTQHAKYDFERATRSLQELAANSLAIDDEGGRTVQAIGAMAEEFAETGGGIDLLVVDYIQLVDSPRQNRNDTRENEVAAVSRGLKALAKRLGCPVITASQLNDSGKLRESRAIGQDADVVLCIESEGIRGVKIRNGPRGQLFPLVLNGPHQRFEPIERSHGY